MPRCGPAVIGSTPHMPWTRNSNTLDMHSPDHQQYRTRESPMRPEGGIRRSAVQRLPPLEIFQPVESSQPRRQGCRPAAHRSVSLAIGDNGREEGRGKMEEGRGKREEGRGKVSSNHRQLCLATRRTLKISRCSAARFQKVPAAGPVSARRVAGAEIASRTVRPHG